MASRGATRPIPEPQNTLLAYDCGDHVHPSPAEYKAIGESIPLKRFAK